MSTPQTKYPLLNLMLKDMKKQNPLYKPTSFWELSSKLILDALEKNDVKDFRHIDITRYLFVPGYTEVEYLSNPLQYDQMIEKFGEIIIDKRLVTKMKRLFTGYTAIMSDYRVLQASNIDKKPYTDTVSESSIGNPIEQTNIYNRKFSRSFMNYLLGLNFLKQNVDTSKIEIVMEIGGGFGTLGEILLKEQKNNAFYINADIPPVGFVSSYYLKELFGDKVADYEDLHTYETLEIEALKTKYDALNICSWQVPKLKGKIDLFVNFISFQEMEPDVVKNYCHYVDKLEPKYILLRNMLEGKRKKTESFAAGVEEPILGEDYDTFFPNYKLVVADSQTFGFVTEDGFHSQLRLYERKPDV